jgi:hypothetical protein
MSMCERACVSVCLCLCVCGSVCMSVFCVKRLWSPSLKVGAAAVDTHDSSLRLDRALFSLFSMHFCTIFIISTIAFVVIVYAQFLLLIGGRRSAREKKEVAVFTIVPLLLHFSCKITTL